MVKILDCTIRDGGYYINWDFDESTICKYLTAVAAAKIDIIEIGFRFLSQDKFLGALAYSTDEYLNSLPLPANVALAVMVNAKELINYDGGGEEAVSVLFNSSKSSPVDIVRIAAHASDIDGCEALAKQLKSLGYRVMLNLMQIDSYEQSKLAAVVAQIESWSTIDVLYFADSFGSMNTVSISEIVKIISNSWHGEIGIHAHDNKGQALANCIASLECGVTHLDSTLLGMGRGAGNVKTECLLVEMVERGLGSYYPDVVFPLVVREFNALQEKYGWGPNLFYYLSAVHGIHPTYIQEMMGDSRYDTEQIISAINFLKTTRAPFFSFERMLRAISGIEGDCQGGWSATGWAKDRTVLIIGSGPGTKKYIGSLQRYIERVKPIVLCLNMSEHVPEEVVTAYVACHEIRVLVESDQYPSKEKPIIMPLSRIPKEIREALSDVNVLDYGLCIKDEGFEIHENGCVLKTPLAAAYAISVATSGGARQIMLMGMDGYDLGDPRQQEMVDMLDEYTSLDVSLPIIAITPTTYPVLQRSIYDPSL